MSNPQLTLSGIQTIIDPEFTKNVIGKKIGFNGLTIELITNDQKSIKEKEGVTFSLDKIARLLESSIPSIHLSDSQRKTLLDNYKWIEGKIESHNTKIDANFFTWITDRTLSFISGGAWQLKYQTLTTDITDLETFFTKKTEGEQFLSTLATSKEPTISEGDEEKIKEFLENFEPSTQSKANLISLYPKLSSPTLKADCFQRLMPLEPKEATPLLLASDDQTISKYYEKRSFFDDNNLKKLPSADVQAHLSNDQKALFLRLVKMDHPQTVSDLRNLEMFFKKKAEGEKLLSTLATSKEPNISKKDEEKVKEFLETFELSTSSKASLVSIYPKLSSPTLKADCFPRLMPLGPKEATPLLLASDDKTISKYYEKRSFFDDNNLKHLSHKRLSEDQKTLLLRLVMMDHPRTVADIQGSKLLLEILCEALVKHPQFRTSQSKEHNVHQALEFVRSLEPSVKQKDLLRIVIFMTKNWDLMAAGAIGVTSKSRPEIRKIKAVPYNLPFNIEYDKKDGDVVVRLGDLGEGSYKTVKNCLFVSNAEFSSIAASKQRPTTPDERMVAQNELKISERLQGLPYVLQLRKVREYTSTKHKGPVVAMSTQLCNMGELEKVLKSGKLSEKEKLQVSIDMLKGLKGIHSRKVIHRDIKPANIFLHQTFENGKRVVHTYVADFGLSCESSDMEFRKKRAGSPIYMPPAILEGTAIADDNMDIWAGGLTISKIFKGKTPFDHLKTTNELIREGKALGDHSKNPPPKNKNSVEYVIWKMVQPDASKQMSLDEAIATLERLHAIS